MDGTFHFFFRPLHRKLVCRAEAPPSLLANEYRFRPNPREPVRTVTLAARTALVWSSRNSVQPYARELAAKLPGIMFLMTVAGKKFLNKVVVNEHPQEGASANFGINVPQPSSSHAFPMHAEIDSSDSAA